MNFGPIILSIGIFNGLMLSFIFLRKRGHNFYLGLFFLAHCFILFRYLNDISIPGYQFLNEVGNQLEWVSAPLLYFYVCRYQGNALRHIPIHFTPLLLSLIILFSPNVNLYEEFAFLKIIQGLIYITLCFKESKKESWLKMIIILFTVEIISTAFYYLICFSFGNEVVTDFFIPIVIIIAINIIAISGIMRSTIFSPLQKVVKTENPDQHLIQSTFKKIQQEVEMNKGYLSPNLKLSDLSSMLSVSERLISQSINESTGENINAYINRHRIRAAEELLMNDKFRHFTIDAIAEESGFSNKVSFYKAFKKIHNMSPKEFMETKTTQIN